MEEFLEKNLWKKNNSEELLIEFMAELAKDILGNLYENFRRKADEFSEKLPEELYTSHLKELTYELLEIFLVNFIAESAQQELLEELSEVLFEKFSDDLLNKLQRNL